MHQHLSRNSSRMSRILYLLKVSKRNGYEESMWPLTLQSTGSWKVSLNKLEVGRHNRILNTTHTCFVSKAFCSIAHQTCTWRQCYSGHKSIEDKDKLDRGSAKTRTTNKIKTKTASNISHGPSGCRALAGRKR